MQVYQLMNLLIVEYLLRQYLHVHVCIGSCVNEQLHSQLKYCI